MTKFRPLAVLDVALLPGELGKQMMIKRGYVPPTCELPAQIAGTIIYGEVVENRDPCGGCKGNRATCGGRPKLEDRAASYNTAFFVHGANLESILPEPKPRPWRRGRLESDHDQVIFVDHNGTETETTRGKISDAWELLDATTIQDENRGFQRLIAVRLN